LLREPIAPGWAGLLLAIPAGIIVLLGEMLALNLGKQIGLVLFYQAVLLGAVGSRVYLRYLPLWVLLFLMVPYEDVVMPTLRAATLWSVEAMSSLGSLPFTVNGYVFEVSGNRYEIVPACAGVNFFTLAIFLGYSFGLIAFRRLLPLMGFTLMCGAAAVLANFFRVNTIIAADLWRGTQEDLVGHGPYQWLAFALMCGLIILMVSKLRLNSPVGATKAPGKNAEVMATRWWTPAAIASLSMIVALGTVRLHNPSIIEMTGIPPFAAPEQLGQFRLQAPSSPWQEKTSYDTAYSSTPYADGSDQLSVIVEMPLSPAIKLDPKQIEPDKDRKWRHRRDEIRDGCYDSRCISYEHHVWKHAEGDDVFNVYSSYAFDGTLTASTLAVRLHRGMQRLLGAPDQAAIVTLVSDDPITDPARVAQHLIQVTAGLEAPALVAAGSAVSQTSAVITPVR
jgi:exosortase/archaeosortase family protein